MVLGIHLHQLTLGFLFCGDMVISVYCLFQIGVVMLFALGIIWQGSFFKHIYLYICMV